MARSKSTSSSKADRAKANNEQINTGSPANIPDVKAAAAGTTPAEAAAEGKGGPESRKLEVVKNESRKHTVVPINLEDEIRRRAYELYQQRGSKSGGEAEDWLTAEREVRQRYQKQQSA